MERIVLPPEMVLRARRRRWKERQHLCFQLGWIATMFVFGILCVIPDFRENYAPLFAFVLIPVGLFNVLADAKLTDLECGSK